MFIDGTALGADFAFTVAIVPTSRQTALGELGERLACHELRRRGYAILARGYRTRHGEIDIVARDGDVLVFVEVKARTSRRYGTALDAITVRKQRRVAAMARRYLAQAGWSERPCRFDVVAVTGREGGNAEVTVVRNAFRL